MIGLDFEQRAGLCRIVLDTCQAGRLAFCASTPVSEDGREHIPREVKLFFHFDRPNSHGMTPVCTWTGAVNASCGQIVFLIFASQHAKSDYASKVDILGSEVEFSGSQVVFN